MRSKWDLNETKIRPKWGQNVTQTKPKLDQNQTEIRPQSRKKGQQNYPNEAQKRPKKFKMLSKNSNLKKFSGQVSKSIFAEPFLLLVVYLKNISAQRQFVGK